MSLLCISAPVTAYGLEVGRARCAPPRCMRGLPAPRKAPSSRATRLTCRATELHCQGLLKALLAKGRVAGGGRRTERKEASEQQQLPPPRAPKAGMGTPGGPWLWCPWERGLGESAVGTLPYWLHSSQDTRTRFAWTEDREGEAHGLLPLQTGTEAQAQRGQGTHPKSHSLLSFCPWRKALFPQRNSFCSDPSLASPSFPWACRTLFLKPSS